MDVQRDFAADHGLQVTAQLFDVRALLTDNDAWTRTMDCHTSTLSRTLDNDLADTGLTVATIALGQEAADLFTNFEVIMQELNVLITFRIPPAIPSPVYA